MKYTVLTFIFIVNLFSYQVGDRYKNEVIELKEELSIGVLDGPEEYIFNRPVFIDADSKGNIYVADHGDELIKVYNHEGKYLKTIGGKGQGPGEFQNLFKIFIDGNDVLHTFDVQLNRFTEFDNEGNFVKTYTRVNRDKSIRDFFFDTNNNLIIVEEPRTGPRGIKKQQTEINMYTKDLKYIRNVLTQEIKRNFFFRTEHTSTGYMHPFPYNLCHSFIPDGRIVYGFNEEYEFHIHSLDDNTINSIRGKSEYLKVTKKDKNDYHKRYSKRKTPKERKDFIKKNAYFPKYKPPFRKIVVDDTGYIIIVTYEEDEKKGIKCDLRDFEGNFLKQIYFKDALRRLKFRNGEIYGIERTEDGWAKVVRYKIN